MRKRSKGLTGKQLSAMTKQEEANRARQRTITIDLDKMVIKQGDEMIPWVSNLSYGIKAEQLNLVHIRMELTVPRIFVNLNGKQLKYVEGSEELKGEGLVSRATQPKTGAKQWLVDTAKAVFSLPEYDDQEGRVVNESALSVI